VTRDFGTLDGDLGVIDGADRNNIDTRTWTGSIPHALISRVASGNGDDTAKFSSAGRYDRTGCGRPSRSTAEGHGDYITAFLESCNDSIKEYIVRNTTFTSKDTVACKFGLVGHTTDVVHISGVGTDDTCDVRTMSATVHWIIVWNRLIASIVVISYKVMAGRELAAGAETPTERGMRIVEARVDDTNLDTCSESAFGMQLVDTTHNMAGLSVWWNI
jgi:hypothetical protein